MKNILHLQPKINLTCGVSKTIYLIAKNPCPGYSHYVLCQGGDGLNRFKKINIDIISVPTINLFLIDEVILFCALIIFCRKEKIGILHSHHRRMDFIAHYIGRLLGIKTVTSVQSYVFKRKLFSYKADKLIACSSFIKEHLVQYFNREESIITVIHNFVDFSEIRGVEEKAETIGKEQFQTQTDQIRIGFIGRLNFYEKGIDVLVEALKIVTEISRNVKLLVVGEGEKKDFLMSQKDLPIHVFEPTENVYPILEAIDILILPSRIEPFGIVLLEAGVMKKAVVASDTGGIPEIIINNENGLLFKNGNVDELAEKILLLAKSKSLRENLGNNLFKRVQNEFSADKALKKYAACYESL